MNDYDGAFRDVGNRTAMRGTTYSYDRADRITAAGGTAYTVDAAGDLRGRGSDSFTYDQANRLKSATLTGTTTTYAYDGDGVRVSRAQGAATTSYVHDRAGKLPVIIDDGTRRYLSGPAGLAYSLDAAGAATSYHQDALRSTRALSDATAALVQRYQRDAWGSQTVTQGTSDQPFSFTGELRDQTTAFIHLRARDYDPATGRFLQRDTVLGFPTAPLTLNRYVYAGNNPVTQRDPSGRSFLACAAAGAIVGAVAGFTTYSVTAVGAGTFSWQNAATATVIGGIIGGATGALLPITLLSGQMWLSNGLLVAAVSAAAEGITELATAPNDPLNGGALAGAAIGGFAAGALLGVTVAPVVAADQAVDTALVVGVTIAGGEAITAATISGYAFDQVYRDSVSLGFVDSSPDWGGTADAFITP